MKKRFVLFILLAVLGLTVCACDTVSEEPMETVTDSLAETTDTSAVTESETAASTDISDTEWTTEALTEPDTEGITEADTSSDTQEPVSIDADLLLSTVLSRESENALADLRLTSEIQISMVSGGNLGAMKTTLMGSTSLIRDGEALALEMNLPSMIPYRLICVDGYLYVSGADGNFRCPLEAADESMIWGDLTAGMHPSTEDLPSDTDVDFLLEKIRAYIDTETPSMLFANVALETDPADRRRQRIRLTEACISFCQQNDERSQLLMQQMFAGIPEEQIRITIQTIIQMEQQLMALAAPAASPPNTKPD